MDRCLPAIAGSALFAALLVWDILSRDYVRMPGHLLLGLFSIVLFLFFCSKGQHVLGWILFSLPFFIIGFGYVSGKLHN